MAVEKGDSGQSQAEEDEIQRNAGGAGQIRRGCGCGTGRKQRQAGGQGAKKKAQNKPFQHRITPRGSLGRGAGPAAQRIFVPPIVACEWSSTKNRPENLLFELETIVFAMASSLLVSTRFEP
jgi:hypothetical protein